MQRVAAPLGLAETVHTEAPPIFASIMLPICAVEYAKRLSKRYRYWKSQRGEAAVVEVHKTWCVARPFIAAAVPLVVQQRENSNSKCISTDMHAVCYESRCSVSLIEHWHQPPFRTGGSKHMPARITPRSEQNGSWIRRLAWAPSNKYHLDCRGRMMRMKVELVYLRQCLNLAVRCIHGQSGLGRWWGPGSRE